MKTILTAIITLALTATAHAASVTFPQEANFQTNVYLHDAPSVPLHTRVPTGNVLRATAGYIRPEQNLTLQGNFTLDTNKTFTLVNDSGVGVVSNGVEIGYNGEIILRRFVSGEGWYTATINPTNPLPEEMRPTGEFITTNDARNITLLGSLFVKSNTVFGVSCSASGLYSTVGGGYYCRAHSHYSGVFSGDQNWTDGNAEYSFVGGGSENTISGDYSAIPGGIYNRAIGSYAWAGGVRAYASNDGAYVWSSGEPTGVGDKGTNTYNVYARGGFFHIDGANMLISNDGALTMNDGTWTRTYLLTRVVTNIDYRTVTPPTSWHGSEMQDVGTTHRVIRAFGSTTNDWKVIYSSP